MAIKLRVVGIFYQTEVDLGAGGGTVRQVMDAAVAQITAGTSFGYAPRTGSPRTFGVFKEAPFTSPTPGLMIEYPPGFYVQSETFSMVDNPNPYSVWQYYVFDENNVYLNRGQGVVAPDNAMVPDKGSVVWRLISVASGPKVPSAKLLTTLGLPVPAV